jgi:hypothetical protein
LTPEAQFEIEIRNPDKSLKSFFLLAIGGRN